MKLSQTIRFSCLFLMSTATLHADSWQMTTLGIGAGQSQALALRSDGSVWAWGTNQVGEMGISNLTGSYFPRRIAGVSNVAGVAAGWQHSLAVENNGTVWAWGANNGGQLGNGNYNNSSVPVQITGITNAVVVSGGFQYSLALLASGRVMAWGTNVYGQLGNGTTSSTNQPIFVSGLTNAVKVVAGGYHATALDATGVVWCWGYGVYGQIGNGGNSSVLTPVAVMSNVVDIAAGAYHTVVLKNDGTVWVWGFNNDGQLGLGNTNNYNVPTPVSGLSGASAIGAGFYTSGATLTNGQNYVWGWLGSGVASPFQLAPAVPFIKYAFGMATNGQFFSLGMGANGAVWAWGINAYGQFGNGNIRAPGIDEEETVPSESFAPTPPARWGEFLRGNMFDTYSGPHNLDFCSIVVPLDMEQGVELNATGSDSYCYSNSPPWFLNISNSIVYAPMDLNGDVMAINNPVTAFGSQGSGSPLFPNQPYRFGVYAGGFDESTPTCTNAIRISVYNATNFVAGATNVAPFSVFTIPLPRRTVSADSNLWTAFMNNGAATTFTTNGLTTIVQFLDNGQADYEPFGISWLNGQTITNFILTAYELTHSASSTNFFYKVEALGKVQVGNTTLAPFATNSAGVWAYTPLYTLDFNQPSRLQSIYMDRLFFQGTPTPPTYEDAATVGLAGVNLAVTNQYSLTNTAYTNLDNSPELRRHPLLDQFVLDMNKDPLALASYVINQIELTDPFAAGQANGSVAPQVTCGGVNRSALGTFLEGRGSPIEQCSLLVYLLRQAGYPAAYVFPTNNNLFMSANHISQLWEVQVSGVLYQDGVPMITNSLLSLNYPWVVANIGTNTVHIFPWLKDHEVVEGVNLYDYMPTNYNTALAWVEQYVRGNTNILNLDSENVVSKLFPEFVQQYLAPLGPSFSMDNLGVRAFNRQHQFPTWSYLPQPDAVTNLTTLSVIDNLGDTNGNLFLTNIFNIVRVQVYNNSVSGSPLLDSGNWDACDLNDRKFLIFTNAGKLSLWLAPYRTGISAIQPFTGPSSTALQSNSVPVGSLSYLAIQTIHQRQAATFASPYVDLPLAEVLQPVTNIFNCNLGDVAGIALDFGQVSPLMLLQHEDTYWRLQQQRATNSTVAPNVWDYQGTAAYLLAMGYFQKDDAFDANDQQWHKVHGLVDFSSGLGIIGATGTATNMQAKVDMIISEELKIGNASLHQENGVPDFRMVQNYYTMSITAGSSQEHDTLQSMFPDQSAVSTVRLLQLAQQQATNGNSPILELYNNNYAAAGNQSYPGYGSTLLKNQDPSMWASITNIFNQPGGAYARLLITPAKMTNAPKTYIGMGALMIGETEQAALISANSATLHGGWGGEIYGFYTPPSTVINFPWNLDVDLFGYPSFNLNSPTAGDTFTSVLSPLDTAGLGQIAFGLTPEQLAQATQISSQSGLSGSPQFYITSGGNLGSFGQTDAGLRSGQTVAEPVSIISGEFYEDTVDLSLPGPLPLQLRRNYTSQNLQANEFGYGWKMNFNPYLVVVSNIIYGAELDGTVLAYRLTNNVWKVLPQDNPTLNNKSTYGVGSTANLFNSLLATNSGTNYVISTPDGGQRTYQMMSFPVVSGTNTLSRTRPYLTRWQDAAGNYASFYYGTNATADDWGQLNRINMANGNTLVLKYDFYGRIIQAISGDGRFVYYQYDSYGDLINVTLPDSSQEQFQYQHYTFTTNGASHTDSTHLIVQDIKPSGRIVANAYDSMRRVITQAATVGTNLTLFTNAYFYYTNNITTNNYLTNLLASGATRVDDFFHHTTVYYYTNNLITNTVDPQGNTLQQVWFTDNATNLPGFYPRSLQYAVDKRGLTTQLYYDSFGNVTQQVVVGNLTGEGLSNQTATNTASFTTNNLPTLVQDPSGNGLQYSYDSADPFRVIQSTRVSGVTPVATNYYSYTNVAQVSSLGRTNFAFGLCWQKVEGGATNVFSYNGNGFLVQSTSYAATPDDAADTDPAIIHNFSYNLRGQMYQDQTAGGGTVQLDYDPMGRVISRQIFDQNSNNVSSEFNYYNRNGELEWYYGTRSNPQDYVYNIYDGAGRNIQQIRSRSQAKSDSTGVEAPAGAAAYATTFQTFDGFGDQTSITDPRGVVTTNLFDPLGRVVQRQVWETNGVVLKTEQFAYENGGKVTLATNALGGVTQTLYTQTGNPYFVSTPEGATNGTTYYLDGRVKRQYQVNGSYWTNAYDDVQLLTTRIFYSSGNVALATNVAGFDRRGNQILTVDAGGNAFTSVFDGLNRLKMSAGPAVTNVIQQTSGMIPGGPYTYITNVLQHLTINSFDAAGLLKTSVNALGETNLSTTDVLGRTTSSLVYSSSGALVRQKYYTYSGDHNSVTVRDGSGASAISHTISTDHDGHTVLSVAYPSSGVNDFTLNRFDVAGNLVSSQHNTSAGGSIANWTTTTMAYDGLNRTTQKIDRDNAATTYGYDPLNDPTNRVMPGGNLVYAASYNSAGQMLAEWNASGSSFTRSNNYTYFASGSPFAGLLQTKTDGRGVSCAYSYDSWLRATNFAYGGPLPEQNLTTTLQYEPRGFITNVLEQFIGSNAAPAVSVKRSYDVYGQLASESVNGSFGYADNQTWDAAGRRTQLNLGGAGYGFGWQADGSLIAANDSTGGGVYSYNTAGMLTSRTVGNRQTSITSRDGEGRPLSINTIVNTAPELKETNVWTGDGLLASHTLWRGDFGMDNRLYAYANASRRLTQEQLNLNASTTWTNTFAYDNGAASGPGVLTSAGQAGAAVPQWSGFAGSFSRVSASTNTLISLSAYGHTIGQVTLSAWLDTQPVPVTGIGNTTNAMQWRAPLQLTPGTHQLIVAGQMLNGLYTAWATNTFTNIASYQAATDSYDAAGNITNRVWLNPSGGVDRTQTLSWDARGRLHAVTERDGSNSGYNWTATYDGLSRRISTTSVLVTNGVAFNTAPTTVNSYYDPQVEFLELGVNYGSTTEFKLYGPDLNGVYGGLNGIGGLDAVSPILNLFQPTVSDERGNILGVITNGLMSWNPARPTGYGSVPGYQPLPLANGANISLASAWRGRWADITGFYNIGLRPYDPVSGRWLTYDSVWNEIDPNGLSYCGGDPINRVDHDGRLSALGNDNGVQNLYFGYEPVMQQNIQTTVTYQDGSSISYGLPNQPSAFIGLPRESSSVSQTVVTQPTGYYQFFAGQNAPSGATGLTTYAPYVPPDPQLEMDKNFLVGIGTLALTVATDTEGAVPGLLAADEGGVTTLYHATSIEGAASIRTYGIDLTAGRANLDFGQGFYTTTDPTQAAQWASRFPGGGQILTYQVPTSELNSLNGLYFGSADSSWESFVLNNRSGGPLHNYDTVSGPMLGNPGQFLNGADASAWGQQTSFHTQAGADLLNKSLLP